MDDGSRLSRQRDFARKGHGVPLDHDVQVQAGPSKQQVSDWSSDEEGSPATLSRPHSRAVERFAHAGRKPPVQLC
jgi:hypothetical protein